MSDLAGEICVVGAAVVSPLATSPAAHAFLAAAGATPAAAPLDGPMKGTFACPWIHHDSSLGVRLSVLAAQAIATLIAGLPESARTRGNIEVVVALPDARQGVTEDDVWLVERSARTALHGTSAVLVPLAGSLRGPRAYLDELLRAGRDLGPDTVRLLVAVDSPAHPERAAHLPEGQDSPWGPSPLRRSEAAAGLALATAAGAAERRLPLWGRIRGGVTRVHESTPDNDVPTDGSALADAMLALPGQTVFKMVTGPDALAGLYREELSIAVARRFERFLPAYLPLRPAALLGDIGLASLPTGIALSLATLRHATSRRVEEQAGPALVWDLFPDGTRVAMTLAASFEPPPAHTASRTLGPIPAAVPRPSGAGGPMLAHLTELQQGCLERILALSRVRREAPWHELPSIERRLLANLDALAEIGADPADIGAFLAQRGDPFGGFAAALALGTLRREGVDGAAVLEDTLLALFGPDASTLLDAGAPTLDALWLTSEALYLCPFFVAERALLGWMDSGPPLMASIALVTLARNKAAPRERIERRLRAGEPLFAAALARVAPLVPEIARAHGEALRALLDGSGALAWEAARGLLLSGDEAGLDRVCAGDSLSERLGEQALCLLALAGRREDAALFARLSRRLPRSDGVSWATGYFGVVSLAPLLLDALDDVATAGAAASALETMLGPLPPGHDHPSDLRAPGARRASWTRSLEQATWAAGSRARDGKPWSVEGCVRPPDGDGLSDRDWQFRVDELRLHGKKLVVVEPGGFGAAGREGLLAAVGAEKRGRR